MTDYVVGGLKSILKRLKRGIQQGGQSRDSGDNNELKVQAPAPLSQRLGETGRQMNELAASVQNIRDDVKISLRQLAKFGVWAIKVLLGIMSSLMWLHVWLQTYIPQLHSYLLAFLAYCNVGGYSIPWVMDQLTLNNVTGQLSISLQTTFNDTWPTVTPEAIRFLLWILCVGISSSTIVPRVSNYLKRVFRGSGPKWRWISGILYWFDMNLCSLGLFTEVDTTEYEKIVSVPQLSLTNSLTTESLTAGLVGFVGLMASVAFPTQNVKLTTSTYSIENNIYQELQDQIEVISNDLESTYQFWDETYEWRKGILERRYRGSGHMVDQDLAILEETLSSIASQKITRTFQSTKSKRLEQLPMHDYLDRIKPSIEKIVELLTNIRLHFNHTYDLIKKTCESTQKCGDMSAMNEMETRVRELERGVKRCQKIFAGLTRQSNIEKTKMEKYLGFY
eukprot:GILJ01008563.1.p1 GENE.GILJ01008563.1~~GILJ01008563.1.p1  ORF type:complete len:472 (+),score=23.00 GILJ01008563.1:72-1418(+)